MHQALVYFPPITTRDFFGIHQKYDEPQLVEHILSLPLA